jgi:hypothetical protein
LWTFHLSSAQHQTALELAQRFCALTAERPDPNDRLIGEQMIGVSQHFLGDQPGARRHIERVLADYTISEHRSPVIRFPVDRRVIAGAFLCADSMAAGIS